MISRSETATDIPLYISRSRVSTAVNITGTWRFMRPGYEEKTAPCGAACPAGEDIARVEMLAGRGSHRLAWEIIVRENPFPAVCGRVCFHPCERACNRAGLDAPIAIPHVERMLGDRALSEGYPWPGLPEGAGRPKSPKRIGIVGSGPAGLSAAFFLARLGHVCDVFESRGAPGGLLRWGIPAYRLPRRVLDAEIARLTDLGIRIHCGRTVTPDFLDEARGRFDALFLGCGLGRTVSMGIAGEELAEDGLRFLGDVSAERCACNPGTAAVIGGGNTAVDVARSLGRRGVRPGIVYRRRREDMPAFAHEVEMAIAEGVGLMELSAPAGIARTPEGYVLSLLSMKPADSATPTGRARVIPDGDGRRTLTVDRVFTAVGADVAGDWIAPPKGPSIPDGDMLALGHCVFQNGDQPRIYGGDIATPVQSVTDAIASGKQAAMALDTFFKDGMSAVAQRLAACRVGGGPALSMESYLSGERRARNPRLLAFSDINVDYFPVRDRSEPPVLPPEARAASFDEAVGAFSDEAGSREASRCFNCGICNDCDNCRLFCPEVAIAVTDARRINLDYCKGCGICATECPRAAISLTEE